MGKFLDESPGKPYKGKFLDDEMGTAELEDTTLIQKVGQLAGVMPNIPQQIAENPRQAGITGAKALGETALQAGQLVGQALPFGLSGLTTTPVTQFGIEKIEGKTTPEALKQAGIAGASDVAMTGLMGGLPPIVGKIGGGIGKFASRGEKAMIRPVLAELLAGVPAKATKRAIAGEIAGKSIFTPRSASAQIEALTRKAQNSLNLVEQRAGNKVEAAKDKLKDITAKFDISDIKQSINNELQKFERGELGNIFPDEDLPKIQTIIQDIDRIGEQASPIAIQGLKEKAQSMIDWGVAGTVKKTTDAGNHFLKNISNSLKDKLDDVADQLKIPELKKANKEYSEIQGFKEKILPLLSKDATVEEKLVNVFQKEISDKKPVVSYMKELSKLDKMNPNQRLKFIDKFKDVIAKEQYKSVLPQGQARIMGLSSLGFGGGGYALGKASPEIGLATLAAGTTMSPKFHKLLTKTSAPVFAQPTKLTAKQVMTRISDLLNNQQQGE